MRALQRRAQATRACCTVERGTTGANASQAGLVLMDVDGAIRALVGGRSYVESQFNRALKARRQPGSAFKMFVYLAALESGLEPDSTVLDLPILGSGWSPRNEGAGYRGSRHVARGPGPVDERGCRAPQHDGGPAQDGGGGAAPRHPLASCARMPPWRSAPRR